MVAAAVVFHHTFSVQKNEEDQIVQYKGWYGTDNDDNACSRI